ncbi:MAG TPA: MBL fold metallo-hydrolase [Thermodesulfobacteriota bacterium]|nr:MBL fold metallo-hydrolase [Thermodesulfobacteriota bacterium]
MKIDSDLYAYIWKSTMENNSNTFVIGGDFPVVIDPGHQHLVKNLIPGMEKDGIRRGDIRLVIATHGHPDHLEGAQSFVGGDVQLAIHPDEEKFLREIGGQFYAAMGGEMPDLKIGFYLKEGELKLGSRTFQILHTPGHSPGSISIYWPEKKALFTGDVVFPMGVGRTDFPGGDGMLLRDSIERLAKLDIEYLLAGHGDVLKGKKNIERNFAYIRTNYYDYL